MGKGKVPNAPHAIIVPNSLIDQWPQEFKVFFKPHVINIFVLPTQSSKLRDYFNEENNSSWTQSKHAKIRRIVLVPHSVNTAAITICFKAETVQVFQSLTGMSFMGGNQNGGKDACPDDVCMLKTKGANFFKMEWCMVWIDEAHEFRTLSCRFIGAVQL